MQNEMRLMHYSGSEKPEAVYLTAEAEEALGKFLVLYEDGDVDKKSPFMHAATCDQVIIHLVRHKNGNGGSVYHLKNPGHAILLKNGKK